MLRIIELEIDGELSGETRVEQVAWVEMPAIEQELMFFGRQKFYKAPDYVSQKACQAIRENEKRGNPAGTQVGKVRAQQLCQREEISLETVKRMKSFLERAETYNSGDWDDNGTIAYGLWGGEEALTWVNKILRSVEGQDMAEVGPRGGIKESKKAPKSTTPNPNPKGEGSAKGDASGKRGAKVTAEQEKTLQGKVDDFNEKESNTKNGRATLGQLKSVFQRGLGAFNTSHSPRVQSAEQWAYARVNAYLYLLKNGRPENPKYVTDNDLLPDKHPKAGKGKQESSKEEFVYPSAGETKDEFIARCIPYLISEGKSQDQASGQCYGMWEQKFAISDRVSFDWDETLTDPRSIKLLQDERRKGSLVYIISARPIPSNEMLRFASKWDIPSQRVFTVGSNIRKVEKIKELGIARHYDNNPFVINELGGLPVGIQFDYVIGLPPYQVTSGDTMLVEPILMEEDCGCFESNSEIDVFGYKTKYFYICPGAIGTFTHLKTMNPDEDTIGMIRSAAQIADNVFKIEKDAIETEMVTQEKLDEAIVLVDDFKDLMHEIDELVGMKHDVSYMDGHIVKIRSYLTNSEEFALLGYIAGEPIFSNKEDAMVYGESKGCQGYTEVIDQIGNTVYMGCEIEQEFSSDFSDYTEDEKQVWDILMELKTTDKQKFEAVLSGLNGATKNEVERRNHPNPTNYFRYDIKVTAGPPDRSFCSSIEGRYFRRLEIDLLKDNNRDFGHNGGAYSKWLYKGGPLCKHAWRKFLVQGTNFADLGFAEGKAGQAPRELTGKGFYPGTPRYEANLSKQGFDLTGELEPIMWVDDYPVYYDPLIASDASYIMGCGGIYEEIMMEETKMFKACNSRMKKEEMSKKQFFASDDERRMIYTPLMIPNILIPRMDETTGERYFVRFRPDTIEKIAQKFLIELRNRETNYEHSDKKFNDIVMVESWIVSGEKDKAYELGFTKEQIPFGTWFAGYRVLETEEGNEVWEMIKSGKVKGASVEGDFLLKFSRHKTDEYLLEQIINILKKIK